MYMYSYLPVPEQLLVKAICMYWLMSTSPSDVWILPFAFKSYPGSESTENDAGWPEVATAESQLFDVGKL